MLRKRLIAAIAFLVPVLACFWADVTWNSPLLLTILAFLCTTALTREFAALLEHRSPGVSLGVVLVGAVSTVAAVALPFGSAQGETLRGGTLGPWGALGLALFLTFCLALMAEFPHVGKRPHTIRIALAILVVIYAGWLVSLLLAIRLLLAPGWGAFAVFSAMFIVKLSDTGAYFVGKQFGKRKLAPILSPGKTIEGALGGIGAALVASAVCFRAILPWFVHHPHQPSWTMVILYGLTLGIAGIAGDLSESLFKRDMGCKDSSGWLPGLGGVMDLSDSVLLGSPLTYFWWASGWLGGI